MLESGALVDIFANLGVLFGGDVATIARTNVSATGQILTPVLASAVGRVRARTGRMATSFVRFIFAIILQIADQFFGNAVAIGASELRVGIARFRPFGAERDVILVRTVFAIVVSVAYLPTENATSIVALEPITSSAFILTFFRFLVRIIAAIVDTVATTFRVDADVIVALEPFGWTKPAIYN